MYAGLMAGKKHIEDCVLCMQTEVQCNQCYILVECLTGAANQKFCWGDYITHNKE